MACAGIRKDGGRCTARPQPGREWCMFHDPDLAEVRRERSERGGRHRANVIRAARGLPPELAALYSKLIDLFDDALAGKYPPRAVEVAANVARVALDYVRLAHELGETAALRKRLDELEARLGVSARRAG